MMDIVSATINNHYTIDMQKAAATIRIKIYSFSTCINNLNSSISNSVPL